MAALPADSAADNCAVWCCVVPYCAVAMQEAASISPPGSMIIANFITADGLQRLHGGRLAAQAAANTTPNTSSSSNGSSTGTATEAPHDSSSSGASESAAAIGLPTSAVSGNAQPSSDKGGGDDGSGAGADTAGAVGVGGGDAGTSSSSSSDARKAAAEGDLHKSGLTSHFKWGCPDNVEEVRGTQDVLVLLQVCSYSFKTWLLSNNKLCLLNECVGLRCSQTCLAQNTEAQAAQWPARLLASE